jgi:hypothetical protein
VVSALGFGAAYYLDPENGGSRRTSLSQRAKRSLHLLSDALAPDIEDPPVVDSPFLRTQPDLVRVRPMRGRVGAFG